MGRLCIELSRLGALALVLSGCSRPVVEARAAADANDTGAKLGPRNELERAVLQALSSLPAGKPSKVGGAVVVAETAYTAASGRTCRSLNISSAASAGKTSHRLACVNGGSWFFAPDVFGSAGAE
jgi:hypothetical protein